MIQQRTITMCLLSGLISKFYDKQVADFINKK
jgi:hypothetical protein